jgi:Ca-activated chloride channel family protein
MSRTEEVIVKKRSFRLLSVALLVVAPSFVMTGCAERADKVAPTAASEAEARDEDKQASEIISGEAAATAEPQAAASAPSAIELPEDAEPGQDPADDGFGDAEKKKADNAPMRQRPKSLVHGGAKRAPKRRPPPPPRRSGQFWAPSGGAPAPAASAAATVPPSTTGRLGMLGKRELRDQAERDTDGRFANRLPVLGSKRYHDMFFRHYGVNPTIDTEEKPSSTFSVDVDTTSYTVTRSFLERGSMPNEAAVRVEEVINSFDYGYRAPSRDTFSIHAEAAPSPNRKGYHVLHLGLKGKEIAKSARKRANLVFVIDVSGSMDMENRLGLVKRSLRLLVDQLEEKDTVGIVTYGTHAREVLAPTSAFNRQRILSAIDGLSTSGATNAEAGLRMGYAMAARRLVSGGINRVVLCSDGVANSGLTTAGGILDTVQRHKKRGITISTVGFGMGNYNDVLMEKLAQGGNGNYHYVDRLDQARKVFVENLTGTLQVIAKDAKIQVAFDPRVVARYRLLGYENRQLKTRDFSDDRVDAGEIGAGHSVTAIYEVKFRESVASGNLGKMRIRFKAPEGGASRLVEKAIPASIVKSRFEALSSPTRLSFVAGAFAEKLRGSYWARNVDYEDLRGRLSSISANLRERQDVKELDRLIARAEQLDSRGDKFVKHGPVAMMTFDSVPVLQ